MRILIALLAAVLVSCGDAYSDQYPEVKEVFINGKDCILTKLGGVDCNWNKLQTYANVTTTIDWAQTRWIAKHDYSERNNQLGKHPSLYKVDKYFVMSLIGSNMIGHYLPYEYRKIYFSGVITMRLDAIDNNRRKGVKVYFNF